ncbi:MAG: hypothetical protein ACJ76S_00610 [Solirubrobacteraceae bacterium]
MRSLLVVLTAAALGLSSALLVACGDRNGLIPATAADALNADLDEASNAVASHECKRAQGALARALDRADGLPPSIDPRLRDNLAKGLAHAAQRVAVGCRRKTPTVTTPTETVPTETTAPEPTPTQTTTEHTTPSPRPPPTTPPPPSDSGGTPAGNDGAGHGGSGGGSGGGDGNGNGGSR